jgi:DNA-directed RNA polymerase subunit F
MTLVRLGGTRETREEKVNRILSLLPRVAEDTHAIYFKSTYYTNSIRKLEFCRMRCLGLFAKETRI